MRLVVPWKYGFKSAKPIFKISFTEKPPHHRLDACGLQEWAMSAGRKPSPAHGCGNKKRGPGPRFRLGSARSVRARKA
ncbi:MAG TPA: hypothetical protein VFZ09_21680 [Archangium sp.]|uniref:hypothetical protein n=1 Tax=Archangium sp. TaxID=1872627 RepID=UPI002E32B4C2|nr:hypothetical protein [Archangium sp.]HEX5748866.1 hypothetical protein [Archangium sp.]